MSRSTILLGGLLAACTLTAPEKDQYFDDRVDGGGKQLEASAAGGSAGIASGTGGATDDAGTGGVGGSTGGIGGSTGGFGGVGGVGGSTGGVGGSTGGVGGSTGGVGGSTGGAGGSTGGVGGSTGGVGGSPGGTGGTGGCDPSCAGKQCGSDGCTGSCGSCGVNQTCNGSQCVLDCSLEAFSACVGDVTWLGATSQIADIYGKCPNGTRFSKWTGSAWLSFYPASPSPPNSDLYTVYCGDTINILQPP